jgi:hypothetical protein
MAVSPRRFPWEYLRQASLPSLQSFELTRLNHAANLRKEIAALLDQWMDETAAAMLARWLRDNWNVLRRGARRKPVRGRAEALLGEAPLRRRASIAD